MEVKQRHGQCDPPPPILLRNILPQYYLVKPVFVRMLAFISATIATAWFFPVKKEYSIIPTS